MSLELVQPHPCTRDEALAELADYDGSDVVKAFAAERIAAAFGVRIRVHPADRKFPEPHVIMADVVRALLDAEGVPAPRAWGLGRFYREGLEALIRHHQGEAVA